MQIQIEAYIHAHIRSWKPDEPDFQVYQSEDMSCLNSSHSTYVMVKPITITVEIPGGKIDYRTARIAALEKEETKLRADLGKRITEIREEVSRLQAIEHKPAEVAQ